MGTVALPIATESGKEEERDLGSLTEDTIIASVWSSLSSSLFTVIQVSILSRLQHGEEIWDLMRGHRFLELSDRRMSGEGQSAF